MELTKANIGSTGYNKIRVPEKQNPKRFVGDESNRNLIMSEKEKKEDDFHLVKKLVMDYEEIGRRSMFYNKEKILKNFQHVNGTIDPADYIRGEAEQSASLEMLDNQDLDMALEYYPLIPKIVDTLVNFLGKSKVTHSAIAVNREAQNEILDRKNDEIKGLLISQAMSVFNGQLAEQGVTEETQPDVYAKQLDIFQKMPKIQKYYATEFRLTVEEWANHKMNNMKRQFSMPAIEKKLFRNRLVCDRPYIHSNLMDDIVKPEVLRPENCAYLRSPYTECVSEGYMFMWYEYDSPVNLIQRFGDKLSEEDAEKLKQRFMPTRFTVATAANTEFNTSKPVESDVQNYLAFRSERDTIDKKYRGEEYRDNLIQVMHMYVQIPRKLYKVTLMSADGEKSSSLVDEEYKITFKPVYLSGKPKTEEYLVSGEHIEPVYINELWRVCKLNFSRNPNPKLNYDVWVMLEKYPVQLSNPKVGRFGSNIPVHGGPTTNEYGPTSAVVDKASTWAVLYNYLWNRINQILEIEIGPFLLMNQNTIPSESFDGSWGKHNILKFMITARDTGLGITDPSPGNMGGGNPLAGGFGQKIDLSRTTEILEKVKLAETIKFELFDSIGISPQLMAEVGPNETATGITQGIQRSIESLKGHYDEHYSMMEKFWQTTLEIAKYLSIKNGAAEESYISNEGERQIFQTSAAEFPLYSLGVYTSCSFDDTLLLADMQRMVRDDNTLGADVAEKISMMTSQSISEMKSNLKDLQAKKQQEIQQQQQSEQSNLQAKIDSDEKMKAQQIEWEKTKLLLEIESNENIAEMKVVGQSQLAQGGGVEELLKLEQSDLQSREYYQGIINKARENQAKDAEMNYKQEDSASNRDHLVSIKNKELQVKREEIMARVKVSDNALKIAKENKPPKS